MIDIPKGLFLCAHECCAVFRVEASEDRQLLYYPDLKCVVPFSAQVVVGYQPSARFRAQCFAERLNSLGYTTVILEEEAATLQEVA